MKKTVKILKHHTVTFNDKFCSVHCLHHNTLLIKTDFCELFDEMLDKDEHKQTLRCAKCIEATNE